MMMQPFTALSAIAAPMDEPNVDTNQLCPTRFNKVPRGPGHARILFHDRRFNPDGTEKDFVLNQDAYRSARIIVADRNFGCGSAREYAVWALYEFGVRVVIAPSFGDIFVSNSYKNGLLPVVLPHDTVTKIREHLHAQAGSSISVDLAAQQVTDPSGRVHFFEINPVRKRCLLEGLDDVSRTEQYRPQLDSFVSAYTQRRTWMSS